MSIQYFIYLAGLSSNLSCLWWVLTIFCGVLGFISFLFATSGADLEDFSKSWIYIRRLIAVYICLTVIVMFMPSKNTFYLIASTQAAEKND